MTVDALWAASFNPPVIAIAMRRDAEPPAGNFSTCGTGVELHCTTKETQRIGDGILVLADVHGVEIHCGPPTVNWRRASYGLKLDRPYLADEEALQAFIDRWRTGKMTRPEWTHAAHVAACGYYAFDHCADWVFADMKCGILHFNEYVGIVNGPDSGYHETLTRFWSEIITRTVHEASPASRLEGTRAAMHAFGEDRDLHTLFYSFDVVRDRRARREWVAPDREPRLEWIGGR
jgi:hypothetical protein